MTTRTDELIKILSVSAAMTTLFVLWMAYSLAMQINPLVSGIFASVTP